MVSFLKLLETHTSLNAFLQIGLDVVILGLLAAVLRAKRPKVSRQDETLLRSLDKIMAETAEISRKFETNLEQRQELLQQVTAKLDGRIQEGLKVCARLEELSNARTERIAPGNPPKAETNAHPSDQQKVLALARQGLDADQIAVRLKRPVGEVELILNLRKIAS